METPNFNIENQKVNSEKSKQENKQEAGDKKEGLQELSYDQIEARIDYAKEDIRLNNKTIERYKKLKEELQEEGADSQKIEPVNEIIRDTEKANQKKREKIENLKKRKVEKLKEKIQSIKERKQKRVKALEEDSYPKKIENDLKKEIKDLEKKEEEINKEIKEIE